MKNKYLLVIFIAVFLSGLIFLGFYLLKNKELSLVSPFIKERRPDLSKELQANIHLLPQLDFANSTVITTLHDRVRYLVYSPTNGKVYLAKGHEDIISPASFTKLMTSQVAYDLASGSMQIKATSESVQKVPTVLGVKEGEIFTLDELNRGSITTSANDAATAIGIGISSLYKQPLNFFFDLMNQKAVYLKMYNTLFKSADGLDEDGQHTTLVDMAKMVYNASFYDQIATAAGSDRQDLVATSTHGFYYLPNWNGLLGIYPGVTGTKIAYTETAGYSTIVTATREGKTVVAILSGADSILERDLAAANLLDAAFIKERFSPVNLTKEKLNRKYKQWADLAKQIRQEISELEKVAQ